METVAFAVEAVKNERGSGDEHLSRRCCAAAGMARKAERV